MTRRRCTALRLTSDLSQGGRRARASALVGALVAAVACCACAVEVEVDAAVTFEQDIAPLFAARCVPCHGVGVGEGGYRTGGYLEVIGCVSEGAPATAGEGGAPAPLLVALRREDHRGVLTPAELALVERWVERGAPARAGFAHPAGIIDPRSPDWHGLLAGKDGYARLRDGALDDACGHCHEGAPSGRPEGGALSGATACSACHAEQGGALACGTCHGQGSEPLPPRDRCFFPQGPEPGAHAAHAAASEASPGGIGCQTCHPVPDAAAVLSGVHGDGRVDVALPEGQDWGAPSLTSTSFGLACAGSCHSGAEAPIAWSAAGPLGCQGCHATPPEAHPPGPCSSCHEHLQPDGQGLLPGARHLDGRIEPVDGAGGCGRCHGQGEDDWPSSGAHLAHRAPRDSAPVGCEDCHRVPASIRAEGHIDDLSPGAEVIFGGRALARGFAPSYQGGECADTACHAGPGARDPSPRWSSPPAQDLGCESCHGAPPPSPHTDASSCQARVCHGAQVALRPDGPGITEQGRARHVNGLIDVEAP